MESNDCWRDSMRSQVNLFLQLNADRALQLKTGVRRYRGSNRSAQ